MEDILERLESLDNVQLRTELLKQGEKVGPVTPTTRKLFLSKLAKKLFLIQHPHENATIMDHTVDRSILEGTNRKTSPERPTSSFCSKSSSDNGSDQDESCTYYVVNLAVPGNAATGSGYSTEHRVFTEKLEALAFMKKNAGARLQPFHNSVDVKRFLAQSSKLNVDDQSKVDPTIGDLSKNNLALEAEKSAFKGPRIQELVLLRKLIEAGDLAGVKTAVWNNPRYLITGADTPVILHEGMRHNALHISAKADQAAIASLVLETILDPEFTKLLYSCSYDTAQSRHQRILYLTDLYLNSPDKGSAESPLHIACKMGHVNVVQVLVVFSVTDRSRVNKFGERPEEIICSRYKGDQCAAIKAEIQELLKGLCLVPLLRSQDNITLPVVGDPCSPDEKLRMSTVKTPERSHSPKEIKLTLSAYAGPMSPNKAKDFQRQWMNPRCLKNTDGQEIASAKRGDPEKGYERIGRKLARELRVPWSEYWQFLDAFADFSTPEGLQKLEEHLNKQTARSEILAVMQFSQQADEDSSQSSGDSEEDCQQDTYYSCDEELNNSANSENTSPNRQLGCIKAEDEDDNEVFDDSQDNYFEAQSYVFGLRLNLKRPLVSGGEPKGSKEVITNGGSAANECRVTQKNNNESLGPWIYREDVSHEGQRVLATSHSSDTTHSFDATSPVSTSEVEETCSKAQAENPTEAHQAESNILDKSFKTVMTELCEDLESKLLTFSPDGKVVMSQKGPGRISPDVGLCLGQKVFPKSLCSLRIGHCPLDVVIMSRKSAGQHSILADILIHPSSSDLDSSSNGNEDENFNTVSKQKVVRNVKLVARNPAVFQHIWHLVRPVRLTVGILELEGQDVSDSYGSVSARVVRRQQRRMPQMQTFIYGHKPCKTDLDVARAMVDVLVEPSVYPAVCSWLQLVTATQQQGKDSWPSPSRLRHQQRLEDLHSQFVNGGSPFPISPLVNSGTVTSTPVSCLPKTIRMNRNLSPERPATINTPRAWLFKSPM